MSSSPLLGADYDIEENPGFSVRNSLRRFFTTRTFHYSVLILVALDVACMFADIIINLETCTNKDPQSSTALNVLKYVSLTFSSLFMLELLLSIYAFGKTYFVSTFHIFDATIIVISFVFEVSLSGLEEEVASMIVILRLLRVVKIVDEISVGAEQQMSELEERLLENEKEIRDLRKEVARLKSSRVDEVCN